MENIKKFEVERMGKLTYAETIEQVDNETGEVKKSTTTKVVKIPSEPPFIKLYLLDMCKMYDIPKVGNNVLNELLKLTNYNNEIILNSTIKKRIEDKLFLKKGMLDNNLSKLKKAEILKSEERGVFMLNPNLFGKGSWSDINKLRVTWNYDAKGRTVLTETA
jgi:hypothetical protein